MARVEHDLLMKPKNENVEDNMNACEDEMRGSDGVTALAVGMKFTDQKEVFDFYKKYAYNVGFPVKKRNSKKDDAGVLCYVTLTCSYKG